MKLGTEFPQEWRDISQRTGISLADILYGYAIEDIMQRISKSSFCEYFWLADESALGENAYRKKKKARLEFYYIEKKKKNFHIETVAGDIFGNAVIKLFVDEIFSERNDSDIKWHCDVNKIEDGAEITLTGNYKDMQVPVFLWIDASACINKKAKEKKRSLFINENKSYTYFSYTRESILAEDIFEIMRKLELISDMSCYDRVNEILKTQSIGGRYMIEEFKVWSQNEPKVVTLKRLEQVTSYKDYGYIKKKWQQYAKNHKESYDDWEIVIKRLIRFLNPIWTALCEDEIFFDDWMPELERFLG